MFSPALAAVALQAVELPSNADVDVVSGVGGSAVGAFLSTLIVGAIMVAIAPGYVERMMGRVRDDPVTSFVYGIVCILLAAVLIFLLVITLVGILVVPIVVVVAAVLWAVGGAIGFLAIADRLVDRSDGWLKPLLVAAALSGGITLTGIGGIVSFAVGAAGFGAILSDRF